jgi:MSHA biogenesis protein MshK
MAESLMKSVRQGMVQCVVQLGACLCVFALMPVAHAEALQDPTRPPAALDRAAESGTGAAVTGPVLQSVLISPRRTMATISGRTVKVGDKVGEARVIRISETEVVLRNGRDLETLKLFPGIEKRRSPGSAGAKTDGRAQ